MSNPSKFNPTTLIIFFAVVIAAIAGYLYVTGQEPVQTTVEENVTPDDAMVATGGIELGAQPYSLNGTNGETISETSFPDKYKLVYFGFTRCPDMCPTALTNITAAMKTLGADADKIQPIFITVDPDHDTDQVIKDYLYNFDKHFVGATGTAEQIKAAQESFRVYASKVSPPEAVEETTEAHDNHDMKDMQGMAHDDHADHDAAAMPAMNHSDYIYFMDKDGKLLNVFPGNTDGASIASNVQTVLAAQMMPSATEGDLPPAPDSMTPDSSATSDAVAPEANVPAPDANTPEAPSSDQSTTE